MANSRRRHALEFRAGAVQMVRETRKPIAQVARDLGIGAGVLGTWVRKDMIERGEAEGLTQDERAELKRLRKRCAELEMQCEVLKRSMVFQSERGLVMDKAEFIAAQRTEHGVPHAVSCRALGVSESTFYEQRSRRPSLTAQRRADLDDKVKACFAASGGTYGSPRVHARLRRDGVKSRRRPSRRLWPARD